MNRARVHLALFTVATLFSTNYIISKLGMREFAPLTFAYLRVLGSAIVLGLVAWHDPSPPLTREDAKEVTRFAVLGVVLNQSLFLSGLAFTTVQVAAILITTIPVFALAAAIFRGSERATTARIAGIALACAGAVLVVGREGFSGSWRSIAGAAMIVGNCFSYALYLVISKPAMARMSARRVVARMFITGSVLLLPICGWSLWHERWSQISPRGWMAVSLVIAGPTVIAYLINAWTLRHADSSVVAAYTYVQPVVAAILGAVILHERMHAVVAFAAILIFIGVAIAGRAAGPIAE